MNIKNDPPGVCISHGPFLGHHCPTCDSNRTFNAVKVLLDRINNEAGTSVQVSTEEYDVLMAAGKVMFNRHQKPGPLGDWINDPYVGDKLIAVMGKPISAMTFSGRTSAADPKSSQKPREHNVDCMCEGCMPALGKPDPIINCTFHCFKASGKWYATERGIITKEVFGIFDCEARRNMILRVNGGKYPGLNGTGSEFVFVVVPDDDVSYSFPLMLKPDMGLDA